MLKANIEASLLLTVYSTRRQSQVNGLSYGVTKARAGIGGTLVANSPMTWLNINGLTLAFNFCLDYFTRPTKLPRHATYTRLTQVETNHPHKKEQQRRPCGASFIIILYRKSKFLANFAYMTINFNMDSRFRGNDSRKRLLGYRFLLIERSISLLISRFLISSRLSYNFLPCPTANSTLAQPFLLK